MAISQFSPHRHAYFILDRLITEECGDLLQNAAIKNAWTSLHDPELNADFTILMARLQAELQFSLFHDNARLEEQLRAALMDRGRGVSHNGLKNTIIAYYLEQCPGLGVDDEASESNDKTKSRWRTAGRYGLMAVGGIGIAGAAVATYQWARNRTS